MIYSMFKGLYSFLGALLLASTVAAQTSSVGVADLTQEVRLLSQQVGALTLRLERLEQENAALRRQASANYATVAQLNDAVAELNRTIRSSVSATRSEVLAQVSTQMEALAKQVNTAVESVAARPATPVRPSPATPPVFSDSFPREGISYTVQRGDTIAAIAQRHNARVADIINANKIADPSRVQIGQVLFIPIAN